MMYMQIKSSLQQCIMVLSYHTFSPQVAVIPLRFLKSFGAHVCYHSVCLLESLREKILLISTPSPLYCEVRHFAYEKGTSSLRPKKHSQERNPLTRRHGSTYLNTATFQEPCDNGNVLPGVGCIIAATCSYITAN